MYTCTKTGGSLPPDAAEWDYVMTLTGGGGGSITVIDNLISTSTTDALSANQGRVLKNMVDGKADDLNDLSDVSISSPQNDEVLKYSSGSWVNGPAPAGGHTMIDNSTYLSTMKANSQVLTDDKVASTYAISNWSNAEIVTLYTTIAKDTDTVGDWLDNWEDSGASRSGWLWHSALYDILSDDDVELEFVFDIADREAVNIYAYRVDDAVSKVIDGVTVNGGAIAIKLNGPIQNASGVKIGINLKRQRTMVDNLIVI